MQYLRWRLQLPGSLSRRLTTVACSSWSTLSYRVDSICKTLVNGRNSTMFTCRSCLAQVDPPANRRQTNSDVCNIPGAISTMRWYGSVDAYQEGQNVIDYCFDPVECNVCRKNSPLYEKCQKAPTTAWRWPLSSAKIGVPLLQTRMLWSSSMSPSSIECPARLPWRLVYWWYLLWWPWWFILHSVSIFAFTTKIASRDP